MVRWLIVITLAAVGACTLFDNDPPDDSCMNDNDCFRAQGEFCNAKKQCELRMMIDAGPVDAPADAMADAMVDAP